MDAIFQCTLWILYRMRNYACDISHSIADFKETKDDVKNKAYNSDHTGKKHSPIWSLLFWLDWHKNVNNSPIALSIVFCYSFFTYLGQT